MAPIGMVSHPTNIKLRIIQLKRNIGNTTNVSGVAVPHWDMVDIVTNIETTV